MSAIIFPQFCLRSIGFVTKQNVFSKINYSIYSKSSQTNSFLGASCLPNKICLLGKKTIAEELGIPEPPKKPKPPFFQFILDEGKRFSDLKPTERVSKLSQEWSVLDQEKKDAYFAANVSKWEQYHKKKSAYQASLTEGQIEDMKKLKQKRSEEKKNKKAAQIHKNFRKEADSLGRPKHPGNKYSVFSQFVKDTGEIPDNFNYMKYVSQKWQTLSEGQKSFYENEAAMRLQAYKKELASWEQKMIKSGREDLLRNLAVRFRIKKTSN